MNSIKNKEDFSLVYFITRPLFLGLAFSNIFNQSVTFDYESFGNYLLAAAPEKKKKELSDILTTSFEESLVTCSLDNSKALSNGDTVTVNLLWDLLITP